MAVPLACPTAWRAPDMLELPKYPRTLHLGSSGGGNSKHSAPLTSVRGAHLVVEEKVDGSHAGLCFDEDAGLVLFHRNTILRGDEAEFRLRVASAHQHKDALWEAMGTRYVLYGEWAALTHSIFYDALPVFFLEDDVYDREREAFLSTPARERLLRDVPREFSTSACVLASGIYEDRFSSEEALKALVGPSRYRSSRWQEHVKAESPLRAQSLLRENRAEGLYIKHEEGGFVRARYKWIRASFIAGIARSPTHWRTQNPINNWLRGSDDTPTKL